MRNDDKPRSHVEVVFLPCDMQCESLMPPRRAHFQCKSSRRNPFENIKAALQHSTSPVKSRRGKREIMSQQRCHLRAPTAPRRIVRDAPRATLGLFNMQMMTFESCVDCRLLPVHPLKVHLTYSRARVSVFAKKSASTEDEGILMVAIDFFHLERALDSSPSGASYVRCGKLHSSSFSLLFG